jgi:hypothetical protein
MCFASAPDVDRSAQYAAELQNYLSRATEKARQQRIDFGLDQLDAIFDGGTYHKGFTQVDPTDIQGGQTFTTPAGVRLSSTTVGRGDETRDILTRKPYGEKTVNTGFKAGDKTFANRAAAEDWLRRNKPDPTIAPTGPAQTSAGFGGLADQRKQAYLDFYQPQLNQQRDNARDQLTFALSRAGLLDSTAAGKKTADLNTQFGIRQGEITSGANQEATRTRGQVQDARAALESQLRASGDASGTIDAGLSRADILRQEQPAFSPLGELFGGLFSGIGQVAQGYQNAQLARRLANWRNDPFAEAGRTVR